MRSYRSLEWRPCMFEKLYLIHNPLNGAKDWISNREFTIGSQKLKDVFGVLYLDDVRIMLRFNNQFKEAVMKENEEIDEEKISLKHVCRMISEAELMEFIDRETEEMPPSDPSSHPSYPSIIELKDGYFSWNPEKERYDKVDVANF